MDKGDGKRMRVSACVIVKNEALNIPKWLACMKRIADELIVVDTGSEDNTIEIARAEGAQVECFRWCNDFSAAKNYAVSKANGEWIVFLDADEYFPQEHCLRVRQAMEVYYAAPDVTMLTFRLINIDRETGQDQGTSMYAIRCFKNYNWLRYRGKVHEHLEDLSGMGRNKSHYVEEAVIYHTGYSPSIIRQKLQRNMELLKKKMEHDSLNPLDLFYLAECYYGLGQYGKAAEYAQKAAIMGVEPAGQEDRPYSILAQALIIEKRPQQEIWKVLDTASEKYPKSSKFQLLWGLYDWDCEDYADAEYRFRRGLQLYHWEESNDSLRAGQSARFLPPALLYLGEVELWKGKRESAFEYLVESLRLRRQCTEALRNLCKLLERLDMESVIALFDKLYDKKQDGEFLARTLAGTSLKGLCLYYENCSGKRIFSDCERQLLAGDISGAAGKLMDSMRNLLDLGSWYQVFHAPEGRAEIWPFLTESYHKAIIGEVLGDEERRILSRWKALEESIEQCDS